ncbi:MAG: hypothetical protein AAB863_01370, partial [Patescibacteria group bacterium]
MPSAPRHIKHFMLIALATFTLLFLPLFASADTIVSSPISIDTVWTASSSPYIIDSGFLTLAGVTL